MAGEFGRENMKATLDMAVDRIEQALKDIDTTLGDVPYGKKRPTPDEVIAAFNAGVAASPPVEMVLPDGTAVYESPWVLLLQTGVEGGPEFLAEYKKAVGKVTQKEFDDG